MFARSGSCLRPIVLGGKPSHANFTSVGTAGDSSQASTSTILWYNSGDHTQMYPNQVGTWAWGTNLFPSFSFPGYASFLVGLSPSDQNGDLTMTIDLLDSAGAVVKDMDGNTLQPPTMSVHYTVHDFSAFSFTVAFTSIFNGSTVPFYNFNAVRVNGTCSNTNLKLLLNAGPLGISPNPSAFVSYLTPVAVISRLS